MIPELTSAASPGQRNDRKSMGGPGSGQPAALLVLAPRVPGANDGPGLLKHLQDGSSVDILGHAAIVWPHGPGDLDGRQVSTVAPNVLAEVGAMLKDNAGVWQAWGILPIYFFILKIYLYC